MYELEGFWVAAVGLAGRVDFGGVVRALGRPPDGGWTREALGSVGLPEGAIPRLFGEAPIRTPRRFVTLADASYPARLAGTPFPPPVLFYEGDWALVETPCAALVGSRAATGTGLTMARRLAGAVVAAGGTVVSGLARGIDVAAHETALPRTIAVLGQGLDVPTPGHRGALQRRMADGEGLVVSELLPAWGPAKWTFPRRNRVIAGLSQVTAVVEAGRSSGALITARWAVEMGRDVYAVPGSPLAESSAGCLDLLVQGAHVARDGTEIVAALGLESVQRDHARLLAALGLYGADLDTLLANVGLAPNTLRAQLRSLELTGRVRRLPGDYYLPVR